MINLFRDGHHGRHSVNVSPPGSAGVPRLVRVRALVAAYHAARGEPAAIFSSGLATPEPSTGAAILAEIRALFQRSLAAGELAAVGFGWPPHAQRRGLRRTKAGDAAAVAALGPAGSLVAAYQCHRPGASR